MERKHKITAQTNYKLLLPILSAVITFFSCQNKEDKQQKVIEVVKDTLTAKPNVLDTTAISTKKLDQAPDLSKAEQTELKQATPIATKEVDKNKSSKSDKVKKDDLQPTLKPLSNTNAEFPGGIEQFHNFFMKEYKKPEDVSYWKLNFTLAFAVEKNGAVSFLECSPAVEEPLQKEIIRVLSLCPKWQPGESNGKKVRMQYSVPILLK
ncbi:hypothetical protein JI750_02530 [Flavobacterium sp. GN10]|uniref:TonB C-terminal domain-containing protein n=1 Tax=Flavobacterium tagetis TaxID=2801336 RepID=A0ABS1K8C5_9FLAO|nr:hypothetical protein [Flavobacterium tagetis]MBL0735745.1 hypothetical protein [Flavobacterium tagetis]